jgi:hypothetical protein
MLRPTDKGNIAEAHIAAAAIELGIDVYKPLNEGGRADLVLDIGDEFFASSASTPRARGKS